VWRKLREAPLFFGLFTTLLLVGAAAALIPGNLVRLVVQTQVLNGIISPVNLTYGARTARPFYQRQARNQCTAAIVAINAKQADCVFTAVTTRGVLMNATTAMRAMTRRNA
jgi:hypothetical protein